MKPKVLMIILFVLTFIVSFAIYLILVTFVVPRIDLGDSVKSNIEVAPELNTTGLTNDQIIKLHDAKIPGDESYSKNSQANTVSSNAPEKTPDNDVINANPSNVEENTPEKANVSETNTVNKPAKLDNKPLEPLQPTSKPQENKPEVVKPNSSNTDKPVLDRTLEQKPVNTGNASKSLNKVMIGSYSSLEEAKKVQENIAGANMNVTPVVKQVNGKYTVQAGAFSDKKKADSLVDKLNANNYSASVKNE